MSFLDLNNFFVQFIVVNSTMTTSYFFNTKFLREIQRSQCLYCIFSYNNNDLHALSIQRNWWELRTINHHCTRTSCLSPKLYFTAIYNVLKFQQKSVMIAEKCAIVEWYNLIAYETYEFDHTLRKHEFKEIMEWISVLQNKIKIRHIRMMNLLYQILVNVLFLLS